MDLPGPRKRWTLYTRYIDKERTNIDTEAPLLDRIFYENKDSWSSDPGKVKKVWEAGVKEDGDYSLYLHVPFCRQRCTYCRFRSDIPGGGEEVSDYVEAVLREIEFFGELDLKPKTLFVGGGTPSFLDTRQLDRILSALNDSFDLAEDGEKAVELAPMADPEEKIEVLEKHGINKVSIGVESFDRGFLERENRDWQTRKMVEKTVEAARKSGISAVYADLLIGTYDHDFDKFRDDLEKLIGLSPDAISVYPMRPEDDYFDAFDWNRDAFEEHTKNILKNFREEIPEIIEGTGYELVEGPYWENRGHSGAIKKNVEEFSYQHFSPITHSRDGLLGFGRYASSYIHYGGNRYQYRKERKGFPGEVYEATLTSKKEKMIKHIFSELSLEGFLEFSSFRERFDESLLENFRRPLEELESLEKVDIREDGVDLHFADHNELNAAGMFFMDQGEVLETIIDYLLNQLE